MDPGNLPVDNHQASKKTDSHKRKSVEVWNEHLTCRLIEQRNSEFLEAFSSNEKNSAKTTRLWVDIGKRLGVGFSGFEIGGKYRNMVPKFNTKKSIEARSGEESCKWKYMAAFENFLGKIVNLDPPAKIEVGGVLPSDLIDLMSEISPLSNDEEINEGKINWGKKENKKMLGN